MEKVKAVSKSQNHTLIKKNEEAILLIKGLGVEGDAHMGKTVKHRSDVKKNPDKPNLRQIHFIHAELHDELAEKGLFVNPGEMGENITTSGIDLLNLPLNTVLSIGEFAKIKITGLRSPCKQLDRIQEGLMNAVLDKNGSGNILLKAGVFGIVLNGGVVRVNDDIHINLPNKPYLNLRKV